MTELTPPSDLIAQHIQQAQQAAIKFIDLQFIDVVGVVKNVTIPVHELQEALLHPTDHSGMRPAVGPDAGTFFSHGPHLLATKSGSTEALHSRHGSRSPGR